MKAWRKFREMIRSESIEVGGSNSKLQLTERKRVNLRSLLFDVGLLVIGGLIGALGVSLFIAPHRIAPGGVTGTSIIITSFVDLPLGMTMLALNVPIYAFGYRHLGGGGFLARSAVAALVYSVGIDVMSAFLPANGLTDEMILNSIFGGVVTGIGAGIIYSAGGTAGGGGVINRLLQKWMSWPYKMVTLYTNGLVVGLAGVIFGWEAAMYAVITFFVAGALADFVLEGPDVVRTALIITDQPDEVAGQLLNQLGRGVTRWSVKGMYTQEEHAAIYCTVTRPEIKELKNIVAETDPYAFVIIGQGHEALGRGFRRLEARQPVVDDIDQPDSSEATPASSS